MIAFMTLALATIDPQVSNMRFCGVRAEEKGRAGDGEGVAEKTGTSHDEGAARLRLMYRLSGGVQCRVASDSTHPSVAAS